MFKKIQFKIQNVAVQKKKWMLFLLVGKMVVLGIKKIDANVTFKDHVRIDLKLHDYQCLQSAVK